MNVAESSVRYPITVIVRVLLVLVFGYVCVKFLSVELKPDTEQPVLVVATRFSGAAPEDVEGEVTTRFEDNISGVSNMLYTQSFSRHGESLIVVSFKPGTNLDLAAAELQRNLDRVKDLPKEVEKPQIFKASDRVSLPVYQFALTGSVDLVTMSTWADKEIAPRIKRIPGVGDCQFDGNRDREMRITFDAERLKARRLTVADVKGFVDRTNLNQSGGYFIEGTREWTVRTVGELLTTEAFRKVRISKPGEPIVYLSDVAAIEDKYDRPESLCRIDGVPGIVFNVFNQVGANIVETIDQVDRELASMQKEFGPLGARFHRIYDQSTYIRDAVAIVKECLLEAIVLVLLVLFVFLKNWRSIVIVATSIPVSVVGTFIGMYALGYSINVLSLAGLALSIGMIVDDAIVVLENIYRHRYEEGKSVVRACVDGTREVGMAAFMCTLTTAAVFMPVLMLRGEVGTLFGPVAFIISCAIFLSLFDAFTVVPMLASRWMREETEPKGLMGKILAPLKVLDRVGSSVAHGLIWCLTFFLGRTGRKVLLIVAILGLFVVSYAMLPGMGYLPTGGTNLIKVQVETYEGVSLEEKSRLLSILEERWKTIPGVRHLVSIPHRVMPRNVIFIVCDREEDSGVPVVQIARQAFELSRDLPLKAVNPIQFPLFGNIHSRSNVVDVRVRGKSYEVIEGLISQIMAIGKNTRGVVFRYTDLYLRKPQVEIRVDGQRAQHFGLDVKDVADAVEASVGGQRTATQYDVEGRYFYIRVAGPEHDFTSVADVGKIILTSPQDSKVQIPLTSVASVVTTFGPLQINHYNSKRNARVQLTVQGRPLGEVFEEVSANIRSHIAFPIGYAIVPFGAVNELKTLLEAVRFVFPLSVIVVYLLLVMQFQSFVRPLSILLSVPLSIIGANFLVIAAGIPFDSFTILGYIMMVGLVVKNAILLITYAVQLMEEHGVERDEALVLASQRRMRPIFMTAIAMVLGMLPLALKDGAGAEIYNGLAMAVVGGLSVATLFTLIFVPVVYTLLDDLKNRFWKVRPVLLDEVDGPRTGTMVSILVAVALISSGCSKKQEQAPPPPPMKVGAAAVEKGDLEKDLQLSGTLKFTANTIVSSEVSAQVQSIEVEDGQFVAKDQTLLIFDETKIKETANMARANLHKDEATLSFARTDWEKNLMLHKTGSISETQYDRAHSTYRNAEAQVEANRAVLGKAMEDLKKTRVIAPISGVLSQRYVEKGHWVGEGGKLFMISEFSTIYLEAFVSDVDVGKLPVKKVRTDGVEARLTVDSYPGKTFTGKLTYIQPVAADSRLFEMRIYLPNPEMTLLQGMVGRGRITIQTLPGVLRVPLEALLDQVRQNRSNTVFLVDENDKAKLITVKIGDSNERYAQVIEGLKEGDRVVVRGKEILSTGQPLMIVDWETLFSQPGK
jgi:hydrophobic/amphiphilic exporter-1 (mainly G- bacteria), HAE1 family